MDILGTETPSSHWTSKRPKWYDDMLPKWTTAWVHYEADMSVLRSSKYLIQRVQGESLTAFKERMATSDYLPLFSVAVDSLVGRMMAIEPIERVWQSEQASRGLGRTDTETSIAYDLWRDCNGQGMNYLTMVEDAAIRMCVLNEVWVYVQGIVRDEDGKEIKGATIHLIDPAAVVNIKEDAYGNPIEVLVESQMDARESIKDEFQTVKVYTLFTRDGTQQFRVVPQDSGENVVIEDEMVPYGANGFAYYRSKQRRASERMLPLFKAELPLNRFVGYNLAAKNGVLYNQESERDNILRIACTPLFVFVGTDKQFKTAEENRKQGYNAVQLDPQASQQHYYAAPQIGPADLRTRVLRDKVADFFTSAFRFYEDSIRGKQKTATEIGQDMASGEGSFLNTLATALDEMETNIGFRLEQIYFPSEPQIWGQFTANRPREFRPVNAREEADKLADMVFGTNPIPLGTTGELNALRQIAKAHDLEFVETEARQRIEQRKQDADSAPPLPSPEENDAESAQTNEDDEE